MRRAAVVAVTLFLVLPALAQFTERIEVRVHEVDVIVETRAGKPVTNLQKDDFIVLQDGKPQEITNFSVVNESAGSATAAVPTAATAPLPQQAALPRKPRKFVFFLDAFAMLDATRDSLLRQCEQLVGVMRDGDEAMVVTPAWPQRIPLFFTPDKQALMQTLDQVLRKMSRMGDVTAGSLMADNKREQAIARAAGINGRGNSADPALHPSSTAEERTLMRGDCGGSFEKCAEIRLGDLKSLVTAVGGLAGKKVVVVMSTHMSSAPNLRLTSPNGLQGVEFVSSFRNLFRLRDEIGRIAAANNVAIYSLEAYEPGVSALYGSSVEEGRDLPHAETPGIVFGGIEGAQDLFQTLAVKTGAKAYSGTTESEGMFEQISRDLTSYYSLGYRDDGADKKDHALEVRVRDHPEYVVRSRRGVRSVTAEDEQRGLAMAAALSSTSYNHLGITLTASPLVKRGRRIEIPVHVNVPLSKLTFVDEGGNHHAQFKVLVAAVGEHADFGTSQVEHAQDVIVPQSRWNEVQSQHFRYDTSVLVSAGHYRVAVGATDVASGETGFQTFVVDAH